MKKDNKIQRSVSSPQIILEDHKKEENLTKKKKKTKSVPLFSDLVTGDESPIDLILIYNKYYSDHLDEQDKSVSSISTLGSTESGVIRARLLKVGISRRIFVSGCLGCWFLNVLTIVLWFCIYYIWPMQVARELVDGGPKEHVNENGKPEYNRWAIGGRMTLLLISLTTYIIGAWGILGAYCGQDKLLKSFILRAPWSIIISLIKGVIAVKFAGGLSSVKIGEILHKHLGQYHIQKHSGKIWDGIQDYLECCGINGKEDWISANILYPEKVPDSCCRDFDESVENGTNLIEECVLEGDESLIFSTGCQIELFELYLYVGAAYAALEFFNIVFIIVTVYLGFRYYNTARKFREEHHINYTATEYFLDLFFMRILCKNFHKRQLAKIAHAKRKAPAPLGSEVNSKTTTDLTNLTTMSTILIEPASDSITQQSSLQTPTESILPINDESESFIVEEESRTERKHKHKDKHKDKHKKHKKHEEAIV